MDIEHLIELADQISLELTRVKETISPDEYEDWFKENLDEAHDLLSNVKYLIGA